MHRRENKIMHPENEQRKLCRWKSKVKLYISMSVQGSLTIYLHKLFFEGVEIIEGKRSLDNFRKVFFSALRYYVLTKTLAGRRPVVFKECDKTRFLTV
jgi:hypothetical protein